MTTSPLKTLDAPVAGYLYAASGFLCIHAPGLPFMKKCEIGGARVSQELEKTTGGILAPNGQYLAGGGSAETDSSSASPVATLDYLLGC